MRKGARRRARWTTRSGGFLDSRRSGFSTRGSIASRRRHGHPREGEMATLTTEHYRAYTPAPFTRAERETTTILFGGLHWRLEKMLQAVLEHRGYKAQVLPVATKADLLTGREVADIGQCCPTSFTTGNLVN